VKSSRPSTFDLVLAASLVVGTIVVLRLAPPEIFLLFCVYKTLSLLPSQETTMPQRTRIRTIKGGPQGEDASITIVIPTVGEMRAQGNSTRNLDRASDEMENSARAYLSRHVRAWNWVDDEGKPMPKPHDNPDVFGDLTPDELEFIGNALAGKSPEVVAETKK
jgi:hypothetical protein